ncbi:hypothetical protein P4200_15050 [Pseudomonas aeruginosa]|nr:hypothetical protein [Pseudomonas aeruginosa]
MYAFSSRLEYDFDDMTVTAQTSYARLNDQNDYNFPDARIASDLAACRPSNSWIQRPTSSTGENATLD